MFNNLKKEFQKLVKKHIQNVQKITKNVTLQ